MAESTRAAKPGKALAGGGLLGALGRSRCFREPGYVGLVPQPAQPGESSNAHRGRVAPRRLHQQRSGRSVAAIGEGGEQADLARSRDIRKGTH